MQSSLWEFFGREKLKKYLLMIVAIFFVSTGSAFAAGDDAAGPGSYKPYTCEPNDAGVETCYCAGRYDCAVMASSGVCDIPFPQGGSSASSNDTSCNDDFGGVGEYVCECSIEITRPDVSRRPDAFNPANETAPAGPSARDRRRTRRGTSPADDIVAPNNRDNEVVPARRGNAPAQGPVTEDDEGEEEEPTTAPTRRDHRR